MSLPFSRTYDVYHYRLEDFSEVVFSGSSSYIFEQRKRHRKCDEYWTKNLAANTE